MEELWKDISGFEGRYRISTFGNVMSLNYQNHGYKRLLAPKCNNSGRLWVELVNAKGEKSCLQIHRIVAQAFIPNPHRLPQINHKDENPRNNRVENLEWCDGAYNRQYYLDRHPEHGKNKKVTEKYGRLLDLKVNQYDRDGNFIREWKNSRAAFLETGISSWGISECCRGNRKTAKGFVWRYAN